MANVFFEQAVPILCVRDLDRALDFYDRLGFALTARFDEYALLANECVQIHLRVDTSVIPETNPCGAYFYIDGVDPFAAGALAEQIPLLQPPSDRAYWVRECAISDPDGNLLRFGERLEPYA